MRDGERPRVLGLRLRARATPRHLARAALNPLTILRSRIASDSPSATIAAHEIGTTQVGDAEDEGDEAVAFVVVAMGRMRTQRPKGPRIRSFRERASDGRTPDRHRHIPVHGHRWVMLARLSQALARARTLPLAA